MSNAIIILGTVLVVLIIYMLFQSYFNGEQKLLTQSLLKNAQHITSANISIPNSSSFSYGIWIYVQQWIQPGATEAASKIFTRKDEIGLYLGENATLKVRVADKTGKDVTAATATDNYSEIILTQNFPIQKWVHVGLVVDGNKFDGYIDGKMVKSIGLNGVIQPSETDGVYKSIEFGQGNTMADTLMIAEHKRITSAMDPKEMWDLYMKGNGVNGLTQSAGSMNVNLSILKDGVVSSKVALF